MNGAVAVGSISVGFRLSMTWYHTQFRFGKVSVRTEQLHGSTIVFRYVSGTNVCIKSNKKSYQMLHSTRQQSYWFLETVPSSSGNHPNNRQWLTWMKTIHSRGVSLESGILLVAKWTNTNLLPSYLPANCVYKHMLYVVSAWRRVPALKKWKAVVRTEAAEERKSFSEKWSGQTFSKKTW